MSMHKGILGQSEGGGSAELTLGDYIARKQRHEAFDVVAKEKKLSFDEWFLAHIGMPFGDWDNNLQENDMRACWKAAQENVPSQAPGTGA